MPAQDIKKKYNTEWVLITGASSGVGKELAKMCAKQGLNIIGVGRSKEKLQNVKEEVEKENVSFRMYAVDLADTNAPKRIFDECKDVKIGCLFVCHGNNNAGRIIEKSEDEIRNELNAATTSNMLLTKLFGAQCEGKSTVTYISSLNAHMHTPYASLYGSVKRFIGHFSVHMEMESSFHNTSYQVIFPGYIRNTDFNAKMPKELQSAAENGMTPEFVARSILATAGKNFAADLGYDCLFIHFLCWLLPQSLIDIVFQHVAKGMIKALDDSKKKNE
jgi:short-subunit dehydrogenase